MNEAISHLAMNPVENTVGIYIGLLLIACVVGIFTRRFAHLPYTIALTLVGLAIGIFHIGPPIEKTGFSDELIFFVFLPPLLFQGALHMKLERLWEQFWPIICFAIPGVIVSTFLVGGAMFWMGCIGSFMVALLYGALISPTDPVSVLALFRQAGVPEELRALVEGESLFNDATGVVLFTILLDAVLRGSGLNVGTATIEFIRVAIGGLILGGITGVFTFWVMRYINDHLLENALCLVLAYGAFWLAEALHLSGVISTVVAGLMIGNYGRGVAMKKKTVLAVENFFESIDFLINSFLFILIGLELREIPSDAISNPIEIGIVAIAAMLIGRAVVSYIFYFALNQVGTRRPPAWGHILFWGGLRGSIPIALLLSLPAIHMLPPHNPLIEYRSTIIVAGFSCVFFSLVVQGVTMGPLLKILKISNKQTSIKG